MSFRISGEFFSGNSPGFLVLSAAKDFNRGVREGRSAKDAEKITIKQNVLKLLGDRGQRLDDTVERLVVDALRAHIYLALGAVVRRVNEHIHDHGAAVRIGASLPRWYVPGALKLFRSDRRQGRDQTGTTSAHLAHTILEGTLRS